MWQIECFNKGSHFRLLAFKVDVPFKYSLFPVLTSLKYFSALFYTLERGEGKIVIESVLKAYTYWCHMHAKKF